METAMNPRLPTKPGFTTRKLTPEYFEKKISDLNALLVEKNNTISDLKIKLQLRGRQLKDASEGRNLSEDRINELSATNEKLMQELQEIKIKAPCSNPCSVCRRLTIENKALAGEIRKLKEG